jgi:hypothetical protein
VKDGDQTGQTPDLAVLFCDSNILLSGLRDSCIADGVTVGYHIMGCTIRGVRKSLIRWFLQADDLPVLNVQVEPSEALFQPGIRVDFQDKGLGCLKDYTWKGSLEDNDADMES